MKRDLKSVRLVIYAVGALTMAGLVSQSNAQELTFLHVAGYQSGGFAQVIGVVRNDTGQAIEFVQIVSSVYDANGGFLNSGFTYTTQDVLLPGEKSPFHLIIVDDTAFARFDYQAQWQPASSSANRDARVVSHRGREQFGMFEVAGQVTNGGTDVLEFVQVGVAAYSSSDELVGVGFGYSTLDVLQPGATSPFSVIIAQPLGPVDHYELVVQASPLR